MPYGSNILLVILSIGFGCPVFLASTKQELCNIKLPKTIRFEDLTVKVFTDRHGSFLKIERCSNHTVAADFSKSDLYKTQYSSLLKNMRMSAYRGGYPIKMTVSGSYTGSYGDNKFAIIVIDKILDYELVPERADAPAA